MPNPRRVALMLDLQWLHKRHAGIFAGIQRYAGEHGWTSIIDEYADENLTARRMKSARYDGVIGRATAKLARRAERLALPAVNVWFSSPVCEQLPGVFPDLAASGRLRAEHLLARGLRHFAALEREDRGHNLEAAAFRATVAEAGFECVSAKLPLDPAKTYASWQQSERRIEDLISKWQLPVGVNVCTEQAGRMVVQMCMNRGWRTPQDVAIIAGWNEEPLCKEPRPSLTSVELGYERTGYEAARLLDQLMDEKEQGKQKPPGLPPEHILLPPQGLVVRESTDFYAVDDQVLASAMEFIAANCHRKIASNDVARAVSVEPRTLHRRFQRVLDRSIACEIRRVRIERAKRELTQSDRSLAAIARDVGFGERTRMYDVFRRELGVTPSDYRKQRQVNAEL